MLLKIENNATNAPVEDKLHIFSLEGKILNSSVVKKENQEFVLKNVYFYL